MKRLIAALVALAIAAAACVPPARPPERLYGGPASAVQRLTILDGNTGMMRAVLTRAEIDAVLAAIDSLTLRTLRSRDPGVGYQYWVEIHEPDGRTVRLDIAGERVLYDGTHYVVDRLLAEDLRVAYEAGVPVDEVELIERAIADLAERRGADPARVVVADVQWGDFPDAGLGVPVPGEFFAQVITPGYAVTLRYEGEEFRYRVSDDTVVPVPDELAEDTQWPDEGLLVDLAREDLAPRISMAPEAIRVVSVVPTEFPDSSLGVPEPDTMYLDVITPGYVITLQVGEETYTYHGAEERVVLADWLVTVIDAPTDTFHGDVDALTKLAVLDLMDRLGIARDDVIAVGAEPVEFPDASLGLPDEGMMYAPVVTPGYIIGLEAEGLLYAYHVAGETAVLAYGGVVAHEVAPEQSNLMAILATPAQWAELSAVEYRVTLAHPGDWQADDAYGVRYAAEDGFLQLEAMGGPGLSIGEAAESLAGHKLAPYGTEPRVDALVVAGQEARLILPSADQPVDMAGQAALVVRYPGALYLEGEEYQYLVLHADAAHIMRIAPSLRFQ